MKLCILFGVAVGELVDEAVVADVLQALTDDVGEALLVLHRILVGRIAAYQCG